MVEVRLVKISQLTDKRLYIKILRQAKLLSLIFQDPILFHSHSYLARLQFSFTPNLATSQSHQSNSINNQQNRVENKKKKLSDTDLELQSLGFETSIEARDKRKRARVEDHLKSLSSANLGYSHSFDRCLDQAYGRRGKLKHELLAPFEPQRPLPQAPRSKFRLQHPLIFPSLRLFLLSHPARSSKSAKIQPSHLEYPPISFLPVPLEDDPIKQALGEEKRLSKRREANGRWRWLENAFEKIRGPLCLRDGVVAGESGASKGKAVGRKVKESSELDQRNIFKNQGLIIRHLETLSSESFPMSGSSMEYQKTLSTPISLRAFKEAEEFGTPRFVSSALLPSNPSQQTLSEKNPRMETLDQEEEPVGYQFSTPRKLRNEGWKYSTVDYRKNGRARRRKYGSLLARIPVVEEIKLKSREEGASTSLAVEHSGISSSNQKIGTLSTLSPLSNSPTTLKFNSSKSPFEAKSIAELIDEVNNPNPIQLPLSFKSSSPSTNYSRLKPKPKSNRIDLVYSKYALHPATSEYAKDQLESQKELLQVSEEEMKILKDGSY